MTRGEEIYIPLPREVEVVIAFTAQSPLHWTKRIVADGAAQITGARDGWSGGVAPRPGHRARTSSINT